MFILSNVCHFGPLKMVNEDSFAKLDKWFRRNCSIEVGVPLFVTEYRRTCNICHLWRTGDMDAEGG